MKLGGLKTLKYRINYLHFVPMREMCNKEHNYNRKERERWKNIEKLQKVEMEIGSDQEKLFVQAMHYFLQILQVI